jgi:hypothetical protein
MNVASAAAPSGGRATPDAAPACRPTRPPPQPRPAPPKPRRPASSRPCSRPRTVPRPGRRGHIPQSLDFARWLNAPMASPGEAAAGRMPARRPRPRPGGRSPGPGARPGQPALRLDWTQLPAAVVAALADPATLRAPAARGARHDGLVPRRRRAPALPGNSPRPVARAETPQALCSSSRTRGQHHAVRADRPRRPPPRHPHRPGSPTPMPAAHGQCPRASPGHRPAPLLQADAAAASGVTGRPGHRCAPTARRPCARPWASACPGRWTSAASRPRSA